VAKLWLALAEAEDAGALSQLCAFKRLFTFDERACGGDPWRACVCVCLGSARLQVVPHDGKSVGHLQVRGPHVVDSYYRKKERAVSECARYTVHS